MMPHGPTPCTCTTVSSLVQPKWVVLGCIIATLPAVNGRRHPGGLFLTTLQKTRQENGATITLTQVSLSASKNSLRIDMSACRRVRQQIPLKPKGLPSPPFTLTPHHQGYDNEFCDTAARVLVRLQFKTTNGVPSHALFAVRNDNTKRRPIAFYNWSPDKVSVSTANSCTVS